MKKALVFCLALTLVLAFTLPPAFAKHHKDKNKDKGPKGPPEHAGLVVNICHFPGHDDDYVLDKNEGTLVDEIDACEDAGGSHEVVGVKACINGHRIVEEDGEDGEKMCSQYSYPDDKDKEPKEPPAHAGMVVNICHFPGHDGDYADYAFSNDDDEDALKEYIAICEEEEGGSWEVVGVKACIKGHRIDPIDPLDCVEFMYPYPEDEDSEL
jgi:hypothetical protein